MHSPQDVFEHYTKAWLPIVADDFDAGADSAKWTKTNVVDEAGSVMLMPPALNTTAGIEATSTAASASVMLSSERRWRLEATLDRAFFSGDDSSMTLAMVTAADMSSVQVSLSSAVMVLSRTSGGVSDTQVVSDRRYEPVKRGGALAIEGHDKWVLFYVDGALVGH